MQYEWVHQSGKFGYNLNKLGFGFYGINAWLKKKDGRFMTQHGKAFAYRQAVAKANMMLLGLFDE